ncbi:MAG: hypothetical protein M1832_004981 [Thelocarpon impressellum]|nr:MAG: hypothetical protein M1832_004981 [Thelocarpon impressellum]
MGARAGLATGSLAAEDWDGSDDGNSLGLPGEGPLTSTGSGEFDDQQVGDGGKGARRPNDDGLGPEIKGEKEHENAIGDEVTGDGGGTETSPSDAKDEAGQEDGQTEDGGITDVDDDDGDDFHRHGMPEDERRDLGRQREQVLLG